MVISVGINWEFAIRVSMFLLIKKHFVSKISMFITTLHGEKTSASSGSCKQDYHILITKMISVDHWKTPREKKPQSQVWSRKISTWTNREIISMPRRFSKED